MAEFCDVAVPVPLDAVFTYRVEPGPAPVIGGRVVVPFRNETIIGVITRLHDEQPPVEAKSIQRVLDAEPVFSPQLMELGTWISQYYLAPPGEVFRTMLPLMAEVRKTVRYRIAEQGLKLLHEGAVDGSSRRSRRTPEEQDAEYAILNYLAGGEPARRRALEHATGATRELIDGMVRKRWILREAVTMERDARRVERYAVLVDEARLPKLNENQQAILAALAGAGGSATVAELRRLPLPPSTLGSLV